MIKGMLMNEGPPVFLAVTEGLLQDFMRALDIVEMDFSRRWLDMGC
ncbi:hypothetical protein ACFWA4_38585 [Streptomyces sp. NPDC060011]